MPLGRLVYVGGALRTLAGWTPAGFRCTVDGEPLTVSGWSVAVANSGRYGGGMRLAPDASLTDGLLDVVTIAALGRLRFLGALPGVFRGTHVRRPEVVVRRGPHRRARRRPPLPRLRRRRPRGHPPRHDHRPPRAVRLLVP